MSGQIWRLGGALRRVVQVQWEQHQQFNLRLGSGGPRRDEDEPSSSSRVPAPSSLSPPRPMPSVAPGPHQESASPLQRHAMIVALYDELQRLEDGLLSSDSVSAAFARVGSDQGS